MDRRERTAMHAGIQRVLEVAVPLVVAYIFFGAPLPNLFDDLITNSQNSVTQSPITKENIDWALETLALPNETQHVDCPDHAYKSHIFSRDPLVIYLENFLSTGEVHDMLKLR